MLDNNAFVEAKNPHNDDVVPIFRKYIVANKQQIQAKSYELKAFYIWVSKSAINRGYVFLKHLHAGNTIIEPADYDLKAFRVNISDFEKSKLA